MTIADVDLLIVGGGFAGLAAARTAAQGGLRVRVVDAKPAIGSRLHTTGIFVKEADAVWSPPPETVRRIEGVRLYGPSRRAVDLSSPGYYFLTTDTAAVLRAEADQAEAVGAEIRVGARFEGGSVDDGLVRVRISGEPMTARWLLGADGARSDVAKAFDLGRNTRLLTGLEREYAESPALDARFLHVFLDSRSAPGYIAWVAPAPGFVQVGLAVSPGRKPKLAAFAAEMEARFGLDPTTIRERRAGVIPCGGVVTPFHRAQVTLVGDAAGMVSPLTAGGIKLALDLGAKAGTAAAEHLLRGGQSPNAVLDRERPRFGVKTWMRAALDVAPANPLLEFALSTGLFRAFARRVFFHQSLTGALRAAPASSGEGKP